MAHLKSEETQKVKDAPFDKVDSEEEENISQSISTKKLVMSFLELAKFRLTGLVAISAVAGFGMAPGNAGILTFLACSVGTTLTSSAANSINQV